MGIKAVIMDLRKNGGGLLNEAVDISGLFIPKGSCPPGAATAKDAPKTTRDEDEKVVWDGPLVVLTSKALRFCLRDLRRRHATTAEPIVVGDTTTHGKGSVQNIIELSRFDRNLKSAVKVTIQKWYAPSGSSIQAQGRAGRHRRAVRVLGLPVSEGDLEPPPALGFRDADPDQARRGRLARRPSSPTGLIAQLAAELGPPPVRAP
jgi:carboxyl-terminal processing protease